MDYTLLIAVIGCVTGVISLGLEIVKYISDRPKVVVKTYNELENVFYVSKEQDIVKAYLHLQILNTGNKHVLLQDVYMKRPGMRKKVLKNLVHYTECYEEMPWETCDGIKLEELQKELHLPCSIPAGGIFEGVLLFIDTYQSCYEAKEHFVYPVLCVGFVPYAVHETKIQAIQIESKEDFSYHDRQGRTYQF